MQIPETTYADADGVRIAYQSFGSGPHTLCMVTNWATNIEAVWLLDEWSDFARRMARHLRILILDHRGTGASDRVQRALSGDAQARDIEAVLDAAGVERAALLANDMAATPVLNFAARHPGRVTSIVLMAPAVYSLADGDYPGFSWDDGLAMRQLIVSGWGRADSAYNELMLPGPEQKRRREQMARVERLAIDPSEVEVLVDHWASLDGRQAAADVVTPTLIVHSVDDAFFSVGHSRWLAARMPNARLVEVPGNEHMLWNDHRALLAQRTLEFVVGDVRSHDDGVLRALVMTDIVGSTERAAALGARAWQELLERHQAAVRRLIRRFDGTECGTAGDSFLVVFGSAGAATRFALAVIEEGELLGVPLRVGVHVGDIVERDDGVHGLAAHVVARVEALAVPGTVAVTGTVRETLVGADDLAWETLGTHSLKGVPGDWTLWRPVVA